MKTQPEQHSQPKHVSSSSFKEGLESPIQFCPGVGPRRAKLFEKLNVLTIRDLFWHLPRGYEDFHRITPIRSLKAGLTSTVSGEIVHVENRVPRRGKLRSILTVQVKDDTGFLNVVWFNQSFLKRQFQVGTHILLHGKPELYDYMLQLSSPKFQILGNPKDNAEEMGIMPIYPLSEGLTQTIVRKVVRSAITRFQKDCTEFLPASLLSKFKYPDRYTAFRVLHHPLPGEGAPTDMESGLQQDLFSLQNDDSTWVDYLHAGDPQKLWEQARQRLVFEELFLHQYILRQMNGKRKREPGIAHPRPQPSPWIPPKKMISSLPSAWPARFVQQLPFTLTKDQINVCREIEDDLCRPEPMSRLLQGDVGSGKTVVSLYAMMVVVAGGRQAAFMAPTEILAQQHAASIRTLTRSIPGLQVAVLRGSAKAKERRKNLQAVATGAAHIVVGTHALFQEQVEFADLGLVVVDEQHKFGVNQRQKLIEKGNHPDLLVATATPIPRTLSLTLFGDMDCSTINSLPPGRPSLVTRWTTWGKEKKVWEFVDEKIEAGQQAYVVCPIIEPSENAPHLPSTEDAFERLSQTFFPHRRVAILHGRHSAEDKEHLMEAMQSGKIDVVVATTVIEVGVDLPNATIMVVLGAERFGLAQLHQLRGRVGRGTQESYCILITHPHIAPYAEKRMRVLEKTRDGFKIADEDLRLRGPGEQFGTRQSGHIPFRLADPIRDTELLHQANQAATELYEKDPGMVLPEHQAMKKELRLAYNRMETFRPS